MKEFQAFKNTLSNKTLKDIYEESKLEVQNETTEGTEAFSVALATQMAINLLESYENGSKKKELRKKIKMRSLSTDRTFLMRIK